MSTSIYFEANESFKNLFFYPSFNLLVSQLWHSLSRSLYHQWLFQNAAWLWTGTVHIATQKIKIFAVRIGFFNTLSDSGKVLRQIHCAKLAQYSGIDLSKINVPTMDGLNAGIASPNNFASSWEFLRRLEGKVSACIYVWNSCRLVHVNNSANLVNAKCNIHVDAVCLDPRVSAALLTDNPYRAESSSSIPEIASESNSNVDRILLKFAEAFELEYRFLLIEAKT